MAKNFKRVLSILVPVLNKVCYKDGQSWALIGSIAAICHGVQKKPKDIDILVPYGNIPELRDFFYAWTISTRAPVSDIYRSNRYLELKIEGVVVKINEELAVNKGGDWTNLYPGNFESFRIHDHEVFGSVQVIRRLQLIQALYHLGRPKDFTTLKNLRKLENN